MNARVDHTAGTIGPNAVIQLAAALRIAGRDRLSAEIFKVAGVTGWLLDPPATMVNEGPVALLHQAVRASEPPDQANALLSEAGRLTGEYLLANRIPRPIQAVLRALPATCAAYCLLIAIRAHAWTFAGSGEFHCRPGPPTILEIRHNPLCVGEHAISPVCAWHAAVFQRLFKALVSPRSEVVETLCEARGDPCCRFVVIWRPARRLLRPSGVKRRLFSGNN